MEAAEQWQIDAALAALSADGRSITRSLQARIAKVRALRTHFEARTPAPRGDLIFTHEETEVARIQLKPGCLPKLVFPNENGKELNGLSQTALAAERIAKRTQELIDAAPQLGLFGR
jgi:hypothetical protein